MKPLVVITGAAGDIGSALAEALTDDYSLVGLDRPGKKAAIPLIAVDLSSAESVKDAFAELRAQHGARIASVIHLAAYFDFTGEESPLYEKVNVGGTRHLVAALQGFEVEQLLYSGTMLVHQPCAPGERINESQPLAPKWAYPKSKAAAEEVIRREHGRIPYVLLHLAGVYDDTTCVPTLAHQIARIYERDFKSYVYSGDPRAGQSVVHKDDMVDAFRRAVDRRRELPPDAVILIGEPEALGYDELQDRIGRLIHGEKEWTTLQLPKPLAKAGSALQEKLEPVVPNAFDQGEKPFIRPFMVAMADDHYGLDITRARRLLGWEPRYRLRARLVKLVQALKEDPQRWYRANRVTPPAWMAVAEKRGEHPDVLRVRHEAAYRDEHRRFLWAHFLNIALGTWLLTSAPLLGLESAALAASDTVSGLALIVLASLSLSWRLAWARWACAFIGAWVLSAPILFWAPTAAGYLNDTLTGALVIGLAVLTPPEPGVSPVAATTGPESPPGWSFNPSSWTQRLPIIALAFVGLYVSRYLAAYQLGHIDNVWEPFFEGGPNPKNGTEEIITSSVSEAWPVSDAAAGALTYMMEILTGMVGSSRRWRTMPWLVILFGLMIVPLGVVSIFFIVIQPIWIGTWCTLCLIGAAAMVVQIPYSLDELVATTQFLVRRKRAGAGVLRVFFTGGTDEGTARPSPGEFERSPAQLARDMLSGGVNLPWNLGLSIAIGVWLMFTRLTLGAEGGMANADHLIGALTITVSAIACAEVARALRFLNVALGAALLFTPFAFGATAQQTTVSLACGLALIALSLRRGRVQGRYAGWNRYIF
ncbi:MAG TPA: vitamin K epoxide reductase family protein [Burkholderiales bacterium]|nr:vitamin K epoxide reductase family protein [Burkholderiales bacterium]